MAWGIGANDVANAMGTSVGSNALSLKQAVIIAAVFESAGALLAGGQVTNTIRGDIIDVNMFAHSPEILVYGMLAALIAAGIWLLIASIFGWPVSTTHSIVGALVGFGVVELGANAVHWEKIGTITLSWIISPIISGVIAYFIFRSIQMLIMSAKDPFKSAKFYVPMYIFVVAMVITMITLTKGLVHLGLHLSYHQNLFYSVLLSLVISFLCVLLLKKVKMDENSSRRQCFKHVERVFAVLMVFTACAMAFAHGSNDVANSIGPLSAIVAITTSGGQVTGQAPIPFWVMLLGAGGIVLGLSMYGYKVIATVGRRITVLTPSRAFAAQLATASTVVIASGTGLPISTTQTLVGAVLGVGFARGIAALDLIVIRDIFMSWVITLPAGAILAIIFFHLIRFVFQL